MPEQFKRAIARPKEGVDKTQSNQSPVLDLTSLSDQEEKIIQAVIQKDELEKRILDAKISEVRKEIQEIRKAGALTDGDDQNTICARCKFKFQSFLLPWVDHGQRCITCKFRVCTNCRTRQPNGSWLCTLCFKYRQEKLLTGEWITKGQPNNLYGSELLRASLRDRSQTRSGYEEVVGSSYIQRPAKVKDDHSDTDTSTNSLPSKDQQRDLRIEKSSCQGSSTSILPTNLQSVKSKDSSQQPSHKNSHLKQVTQPSSLKRQDGDYKSTLKHPEGSSTGHLFPKLQLIASTPFADTVNSDDVMASLSLDNPLGNSDNATDTKDNTDAHNVDKSRINEPDHNPSNQVQIDHLNSTHIQLPSLGKRTYLNRNISVSEQTLYYDDVRLANPNIPRFSSLDSRSISSLCSDYSINPKYRSMKQSSGTSELELFRKRGERYSQRRKKTVENESSVEKDDSRLEMIQDSNAAIDSSSGVQTSTEIKPTPIPHWHEILRVQSIVESRTKQNKSPIATSSPVKSSEPSVDYKTFPLVNPKTKTALLKDSKYLSPNNSKDDSSSSQESISVCVASYMSPTKTLNLKNIFSSTPNAYIGSESTPKSVRRQDLSSGTQISPISAVTLNSTQEERSQGSMHSKDVELDLVLSLTKTRHKSDRSYFSIIKSRNWTKLKDWRGKQKLPSVVKLDERLDDKGKNDNDKVNWAVIQRQNSYVRMLENQKVAINSPKDNAVRTGCWWKDGTSDSVHVSDETETLELRRGHDSDTSSLSSFTTGSWYASNSIDTDRSSDDCRSLDGSKNKKCATVAVTSSVLPSKFRFRRLSSSLSVAQRSASQDCSSPHDQENITAGVNASDDTSHLLTSKSHNLQDADETSDKYKNTSIPTYEENRLMNTCPKEEEITKRALSRSEDSFDEIYYSNVNLYVQMMNCESQEGVKGRSSSTQKRILPQCPLDGKNPQFLLQHSLSLSEEMAENAVFECIEDNECAESRADSERIIETCREDSECPKSGANNNRIIETGIQEEKLLLPSEIRKQSLWGTVAFSTISRHHIPLQKSELPFINTPSLSLREGFVNIEKPVMPQKECSTRKSAEIQSQVNSPYFHKPCELEMATKSHQLEVKQRPEVMKSLQGNLNDSMSRSGSNVSDNFSIVTDMSELHGEAENYNSDQDSDDTFHNSNIKSSFSDDGIESDLMGYTQQHEELRSQKSNNFYDRTQCKCSRPKASRKHDDLQQCDYYPKCIQHEGDITSQIGNSLENSNQEGYFLERELSIDSQISDLDNEDLVCSSMSIESTESHLDVKLATYTKLRVDIHTPSIEGSYYNEDKSKRNEDVDKDDEFMNEKVDVEISDYVNNQTTAVSMLDTANVDKTSTTYPHVGWKRMKWTDLHSHNHLTCADVDLDDNCNQTPYLQVQGHGCEKHEAVKDAGGGIKGGNKVGISSNDRFRRQSADQTVVPAIAVTNMAAEQNVKEEEEEEDDLDELFSNHHPNHLLGSRDSLADSRESICSIYSDAGEVNHGHIHVTGEIMLDLNYNYKTSTFEVHVIQCKDLAPVDNKHNKSDPYVKTYLLPDKTRSSKRKTRIKKHTLGPVFDEVLKYQISKGELEARTLSVTVWHNDRFGRNDFLGEVTINLDYYGFDESAPRWYPLQERQTMSQDSMMSYKGDLFLSLMYVTPDMAGSDSKKKSGSARKKGKEKDKTPQSGLGEIHVLVKEAQNLTAVRGSAGSDPFCKGYLLPDATHVSKQKTPVIKKTTNPHWHCNLVFEGVDQSQLHQHGLELTIWDYERLSSNDFLGGVRLSLGKDTDQGKMVEWMDSRGEEVEAWQSMIDHPNDWVDVQLPLRVSMGKQSVKK